MTPSKEWQKSGYAAAKKEASKYNNETLSDGSNPHIPQLVFSTLAFGIQKQRNFFITWQRNKETQKERETKWSFVAVSADMFLFAFKAVIVG